MNMTLEEVKATAPLTSNLPILTIVELRAAILARSKDEQREILQALEASLETEDGEWVDEWPPELLAEWERRAEDMKSGKVKTISHEEVMKKLREMYP
jgi:putative addiction module component (TIGR02574 family)